MPPRRYTTLLTSARNEDSKSPGLWTVYYLIVELSLLLASYYMSHSAPSPAHHVWVRPSFVNCLADMRRSLKDTLRAVNSAFAEKAVAYPLHDDLERAIERSVDPRAHLGENESQQIHEELLMIYNCHVAGNVDKQPPFVAALRLMRPVIRGEQRLDAWWNLLIRPTIDSCGPRRDSIEEAREFLLRILVFDAEEDRTGEMAAMSAVFTRKLLDCYLVRTKIPSGDDVVSPEDEFIAQELEGILVAFGRKKPKVCLTPC
jgi:hypothetical protein